MILKSGQNFCSFFKIPNKGDDGFPSVMHGLERKPRLYAERRVCLSNGLKRLLGLEK